MTKRNECPGCSGTGKLVPGKVSIYVCSGCNGIFGDCYLGESYEYVLPYWSPDAKAEGRYYDFTCLGSGGMTRRKGWFNPADKKILQTG
jgi:hypothetical protein